MITFTQKCFKATISTSDWGGYELVGYFIDENIAKDVVKGKGWWGSDGSVQPTELNIKIFENREEFDGVTLEDERQAALAKLTDQDKKLLNLK